MNVHTTLPLCDHRGGDFEAGSLKDGLRLTMQGPGAGAAAG